MRTTCYQVTSLAELVELFADSESAYDGFSWDYAKSRYGSYQDLQEMPEYQLNFEPYIQIAEKCGMKSLSLKRSSTTGRFYAWNINLGGHTPRLELRPVTLNQVVDLALMKQYHENWACGLGCNIEINPACEI